jgi:A/G-specific adenine glycosylase
MISLKKFQKTIWNYYGEHKRPMPWRQTRDPYRILVSEIMLQQTQVSRVIGFYKNFIKQFPSFRALAAAKTADVLKAWQGLGYNRRALALQNLAKEVVKNYNGTLPRDTESLISLPGIGPYTAGAIRAFAFNEPGVFIATNIRRVFIHFFFPGQTKVTDAMLVRYIERTVDQKNPREWYYALMDYGSMMFGIFKMTRMADVPGLGVSTRSENPNRRSAHYTKQSAFAGSERELRGKIIRFLIAKKKASPSVLSRELGEPSKKIEHTLTKLIQEGFIVKKDADVRIIK